MIPKALMRRSAAFWLPCAILLDEWLASSFVGQMSGFGSWCFWLGVGVATGLNAACDRCSTAALEVQQRSMNRTLQLCFSK